MAKTVCLVKLKTCTYQMLAMDAAEVEASSLKKWIIYQQIQAIQQQCTFKQTFNDFCCITGFHSGISILNYSCNLCLHSGLKFLFKVVVC